MTRRFSLASAKPFLDCIDYVADHGFDTVEFATWFDKDRDALEARLEENGMSIAAMAAIQETGMSQDFKRAITNPDERETVIGDIEKSIEVAERFGCPNLIVLVGPELDTPHEEQFDSVVTCLQKVAPTTEAAEISLVIEPLNEPVDCPGFFLKQSQTGYEIIREVDSPAIKLLFDIYYQQVSEGNILANVTDHLDEIAYIHVADVPGRHEPGTGELHYRISCRPSMMQAMTAPSASNSLLRTMSNRHSRLSGS